MTACVESVPAGAIKPTIATSFPPNGTSGHSATLRVTVEHGRGEAVLAEVSGLPSTEPAWTAARSAGFALPHQDGDAAVRLTEPRADPARPERSVTVLDLPLVLFPPGPGRAELTLPPLPVAVSRASGEIMIVCTPPHAIVVEDPIANVSEAKPQPNPPPLPQREDWAAARIAAFALALVLVAAFVAAVLAIRWARRPKPLPPPPPRRPPWETALERLARIRASGLIEQGKRREYVDGVSDTLREYLGARYGFDGIESTTEEIRHSLARAQLGVPVAQVIELLEACDLVKFARVEPPPSDCTRLLVSAESIVRGTMAVAAPPIAAPSLPGATPPFAPPPSPPGAST